MIPRPHYFGQHPALVIPRYSRPEMARIWTAENRFRKWLDIEIYACEAHAQMGTIPFEAVERIKARAKFDVTRIDEIEKVVKHDVIAFLTSVADYIGDDSRFVHLGLTSSDVLDTSFAMLLTEAADLIIDDIERLMAAIRKQLEGLSEKQANARPAEGEWSVKEIVAHFVLAQRDYQAWVADMINDVPVEDWLMNRSNNLARITALSACLPSLPAMLEALEQALARDEAETHGGLTEADLRKIVESDLYWCGHCT